MEMLPKIAWETRYFLFLALCQEIWCLSLSMKKAWRSYERLHWVPVHQYASLLGLEPYCLTELAWILPLISSENHRLSTGFRVKTLKKECHSYLKLIPKEAWAPKSSIIKDWTMKIWQAVGAACPGPLQSLCTILLEILMLESHRTLAVKTRIPPPLSPLHRTHPMDPDHPAKTCLDNLSHVTS